MEGVDVSQSPQFWNSSLDNDRPSKSNLHHNRSNRRLTATPVIIISRRPLRTKRLQKTQSHKEPLSPHRRSPQQLASDNKTVIQAPNSTVHETQATYSIHPPLHHHTPCPHPALACRRSLKLNHRQCCSQDWCH